MHYRPIFLLLFAAITTSLAAPHEGLPLLNPGGIGGIFKGPDSQTIIRGPDGSEITSEEKPGIILRGEGLAANPIIVAEPEIIVPPTAPLIKEETIIANGPIISSTALPIPAPPALPLAFVPKQSLSIPEAPLSPPPSPLLTGETYLPKLLPDFVPFDAKPVEIIEQDPHIIETEIIPAPEFEPDQNVDIKGSSGRIITKGSASVISGPASTTITEPRKIVFAPPKIVGTPVIATATIPLAPFVGPAVTPIPAAPLISFEASTIAPPVLSSTAAPIEYGYSTTAGPVQASSLGLVNSKDYLSPAVEYNALYGVLPGPVPLKLASSPDTFISSTASSISESYSTTTGAPIPAEYLMPPAGPAASSTLAPVQASISLPIASPYIQKIPKLEEGITADGRVDMGNTKTIQNDYRIPQVLGMALSRFYRKIKAKDKESVTIDDKMGDLSQNEILSGDRQAFLPPNLARAQYIGPALQKSGIDPLQVNLAPVPLSQVTKLTNYPLDPSYFRGRYEREAKKKSTI